MKEESLYLVFHFFTPLKEVRPLRMLETVRCQSKFGPKEDHAHLDWPQCVILRHYLSISLARIKISLLWQCAPSVQRLATQIRMTWRDKRPRGTHTSTLSRTDYLTFHSFAPIARSQQKRFLWSTSHFACWRAYKFSQNSVQKGTMQT